MDKETGKYKILSDIQGLEDFAGDMDFKVTGTSEGITALQMDIKLKGLQLDLLREALNQAEEGRKFIMDKMLEVIPEPRKQMSQYAPMIMSIQIDPDMIRVVIGKGGETIQKITAECGVEIDINDEGLVTVTAPDQESGQKAIDWIERMTVVPEVGKIYESEVVKIMDFGAFVKVGSVEGLVHISKMANERVNKVEDVVKMGDKVKVKLTEVDDQGRYNFSMKDAKEGGEQKPQASQGGAPDEPQQGKGGHGETVPGTTNVRKVNGR